MPRPNFHIIGAPKCGTETISNWLREHPEVFIPKDDGIHFHARDLDLCIPDRAYYERCFATAKTPAIGEVSPWYLFSDEAIPRILEETPDTRLIVCLRNPIEMAWVLHSAAVADAREHVSNFPTAWAMSHLRRQGRGGRRGSDAKTLDYSGICSLGDQLLRLTALAEADQIHLVFLDDILKDPRSVWDDLQIFLGIDIQERHAFPVEDFLIERPLPTLHTILRRLSDTRGAVLPQRFLRLGIARSVNGWNRRAGTLREMPVDLRRRVSEGLSEDVGVISAMSGRDLSHWLC